jgi:hypothetical protein
MAANLASVGSDPRAAATTGSEREYERANQPQARFTPILNRPQCVINDAKVIEGTKTLG